jgi:dsRNA-specific ribonuclease
LKRDTKFEFIVENSTSMIDEQHEFQVVAIIDEHRFVGTGRSKRIAKTRAAQLALEKLFGMCFDKEGK